MVKPNDDRASKKTALKSLPASSHVLRGMRLNAPPVRIGVPGQASEGRLNVRKEGGVVKALEYRCACGRTDHFICE